MSRVCVILLKSYNMAMFSDISGHWAEQVINSSALKGWINGYEDGTFRPDNYITRAEAMALINNQLNRRVNKEGIHPDSIMFADNDPSAWYYETVVEATNSHEYAERTNVKDPEKWTAITENKVWP